MKVCVIGSGGREHGLAVALGRTAEVVVSPGNPGIPQSVPTPAEEIDADLFVIGPEQPLVDGLADRLRSSGRRVFGPGTDGAQVEGSKAFMKALAHKAGVPTARHGVFTEPGAAAGFLRTLSGLYVVKTDGLAAGKGVLVTESLDEAIADVEEKLSGAAFGDAGRTVVIEEGLRGPESSVFVVCDGARAVALPPAQDFKRVGDGDTGPNTGGMGAWSPVPGMGAELVETVVDEFVEPTLAALRAQDIDYRGVLYTGLMLTPEGPKLIEYNIRFGDPDSQVVLLRLTSDLAELLAAAADGDLGRADPVEVTDDTFVLVVAASEGYPASPRTGDVIAGLDEAAAIDGVEILYSGVASRSPGELVTAGGRVVNVVGRGHDAETARHRAYTALGKISWPGMHYRTDIAAGGPNPF